MTQVSIVKELEERAGIGRTTAKNTIRDVKAAMGVDTTEYSDATRGQILQAAESGHAMCAVTSESTFEEIRDSGIFNGSKALEHRLLFGQCVAALFDKCETVQGGSDFGQRCAEYWGLSRTAAQNALEIGRREYFSEFGKVLPTAESTLLELAKLPEQTFKEKVESGDIKPTMTAADAKAFSTPKTAPQTAQQPRGDVPPPSDPDAVEVSIVDGEVVSSPAEDPQISAHEKAEIIASAWFDIDWQMGAAIDAVEEVFDLLEKHEETIGASIHAAGINTMLGCKKFDALRQFYWDYVQNINPFTELKDAAEKLENGRRA